MTTAQTRDAVYYLRATRNPDPDAPDELLPDQDVVRGLISRDQARNHVVAIKVLSRLNDGSTNVDVESVLALLGCYEDTGEIYLVHSGTGVRWVWACEDWVEVMEIVEGPLSFDDEDW